MREMEIIIKSINYNTLNNIKTHTEEFCLVGSQIKNYGCRTTEGQLSVKFEHAYFYFSECSLYIFLILMVWTKDLRKFE